MASYDEDKREILNRLRRIEGQLRGIQRMVEEGKYCVDILNQLSSVMAATHRVGGMLLRDHIQGCVRNALSEGRNSDTHVKELIDVVERFRQA